MKAHPDFVDFVSMLNKNEVEFVIVGAYALAFHGHPRATGDIDFYIRPEKENAQKLLAALNDFGFGELDINMHDILSGKIIQLGFPPVRIDLISKLDGLSDEEVWNSKERGSFADMQVWYLSKDSFIKNKLFTGRHKDLADLELLGERTS